MPHYINAMRDFDIPPDIQIQYLRRRLHDFEQLETCAEASLLFEIAKKIGHQVKGNAENFGYSEFSNYARSLESAATSQNAARILEITKEFKLLVEDKLKRLL